MYRLLAAATAILAGLPVGLAQPVDVDSLADPTRPLYQAAPVTEAAPSLLDRFRPPAAYEVNSILIRPDMRVAVVNSTRVGVGDSIGAARVTAIEPGRVVLEEDGVSRELRLHGPSIKTPVDSQETE